VARLALLLALAAAGAFACQPSRAPNGSAPATAPATRTALDDLADRLLAARSLRIRARVASEGRIQSRFEGTLVAGRGQRMRITLEGSFGGRDASALLVCDGVKMRGGSRAQRFEFDAPPFLRERILVGFVRMGLAHDTTMLAMGQPPDHLDGNVARSLEVVGASHAPGAAVRGAATESWNWALLVDHKAAADQELWLDARTNLPVRRRVSMHFPEGDVDFGEEYDEVALDVPVDEGAFVIVP
jgi:hypothetical protein